MFFTDGRMNITRLILSMLIGYLESVMFMNMCCCLCIVVAVDQLFMFI